MNDQNTGTPVSQDFSNETVIEQENFSYSNDESPALNVLNDLMKADAEASESSEEDIQTKPENEEIKKDEDDQFSRKFAAISRKEKQLRAREQEIDSKLKALEEKLASVNAPKEEPQKIQESLESKLRKNPLAALQEMGFDLNTLGKIALQDGKLPIEMQMQLMREELKSEMMTEQQKLREEIDAQKREKAERQEREAEARDKQVIEDFKADIKSFVEQNVEKYELISLTESENLVYNVILEQFQNTETELSFDEACGMVEAYLEEDAKKVLEKSKKFQNSNRNPQASSKPTQNSGMSVAKPTATLTNDNSSVIPNTGGKFLSDEESKREAAKLIRWSE